MNIILYCVIISGFIAIGSTQTCRKSKELEADCGKYCYTVVKPVLEHTVFLQKQLNTQDLDQKKDTQSKFDNIENQLKILQAEVSKLKQNSAQQMLEDHQQLFEKIGSKYYYIEKHQVLNWFSAVHKCHEFGGHLVNLQNHREFDALKSKLKSNLYWTDVNDLGHEGVYLSHTTGRPASFVSWYQGEPNNNLNTENCVCLEHRNNEFHMNDQSCTLQGYFICEL